MGDILNMGAATEYHHIAKPEAVYTVACGSFCTCPQNPFSFITLPLLGSGLFSVHTIVIIRILSFLQ